MPPQAALEETPHQGVPKGSEHSYRGLVSQRENPSHFQQKEGSTSCRNAASTLIPTPQGCDGLSCMESCHGDVGIQHRTRKIKTYTGPDRGKNKKSGCWKGGEAAGNYLVLACGSGQRLAWAPASSAAVWGPPGWAWAGPGRPPWSWGWTWGCWTRWTGPAGTEGHSAHGRQPWP